jgi:hypothetical protein
MIAVAAYENLRARYCHSKRKRLYCYAEHREFVVDGRMYLVPRDYEWDGATVPRLLWWLFSPTGITQEAASLHDWLYDTKGRGMQGYTQHGLTRAQVDRLFLRHMLADGTPRLQAWMMWAGVRTWIGLKFWNDDSYPTYLLN